MVQQRRKAPAATTRDERAAPVPDYSEDEVEHLRPARLAAVYAVTFFAAMAVYANSLDGEFALDDNPAINDNADVDSSKTGIASVFADNFWGERMDAPDVQHQSYRPLTVLTFRWNHEVHGMRVWGYHAVNVLLHAIVSCLVVLVCKRLLTRPSFTTLLVTGLAFALHPVHTEAVSGLVGRAEILSGLFFCLSMLTYHRAEGNALLVLPAVVLAAAAALSKEQGVTVIGVACVYDLFVVLGFDARAMLHASSPASGAAPRKETQSKKAQKAAARAASSKPMTAGEKFAMRQLLLWTSFAVFMSFRLSMNSVHIEVDAKTNPANHIEDFVNRGLTKALYCTLHAWLLIFPRFLSCDWAGSSIALVEGLADPRNLGTLALVGALGALGLYALFGSARRETRANLIVALALLIVPFVPSTGLFMEVGFVLAERVLYLPSIGFCLLLAMAFDRIQRACSAVPRSLVWAGLACVLAWYAGRTWSRNEDWSTPRAIYLSSLEAAPDNAKLHHNAAYYLDMETEAEKKEFHLREAIRLYPPYISAYVNLGVLLSQTGREEASVDVYKKGIEMHYKHPLYSSDVTIFYSNMGFALNRIGRYEEALEAFETAVKNTHPNDHRYQQRTNMVAQLRAQLGR